MKPRLLVALLALSLIASPVMACGMNKRCPQPTKYHCYSTPFGKWCVR
jgi:hypothetical protein